MTGRPLILFDWGDTLMRDFGIAGPMRRWPVVKAVDGAAEVLEHLSSEADLALATNAADSEESEIREALARVGLETHLSRIFCAKGLGMGKSHPDFFPRVLEATGIPPERAAMVGDSFEADVAPAVRAGLFGVWLNENGTHHRASPFYATIHKLVELPACLATMGLMPAT